MSNTFVNYDESYPPSIYGAPVPPPPATGANAGAPGTWTPSGSTPPANAAGATGIVANPATDWTVGQYVQGTDAGAAGQMNWNGTAWVAGISAVDEPVVEEAPEPPSDADVSQPPPSGGTGERRRRPSNGGAGK